MTNNAVKEPAFAERFNTACAANPNCPPVNSGRYPWFVDQFKKRFGRSVTIESVRRWNYGESLPRRAANDQLAEILNVDPSWLWMGVGEGTGIEERRAKRAQQAETSGSVDLVAALIRMDGGSVAFPEADDKRAARMAIDMYAIIKGANYAFAVVKGDPVEGGFSFAVPGKAANDEVVTLGVLRDGFSFRVIEITADLRATGTGKLPTINVVVPAADIAQYEIRDFKTRL